MKKILFAAIFLLFFSCSKSESESSQSTNNPSAFDFSGKWKLASKVNHDGIIQNASWCEDQYNWYQFGVDNGAIVGAAKMIPFGGGTFTCEQSTINGTYSVSNDTLTYTWTISGYKTKYKIISTNSLSIQLEMISYESATGINVIPNNQRKKEICNKVE